MPVVELELLTKHVMVPSKFYCLYNRKCKARSLRCVGANVCNNLAANKYEGCHETLTPGKYEVCLGHVKLISSKNNQFYQLEHRFIEYRGFVEKL